MSLPILTAFRRSPGTRVVARRRQSPYLWSYTAGIHGKAKILRMVLKNECRRESVCDGGLLPSQSNPSKLCGEKLCENEAQVSSGGANNATATVKGPRAKLPLSRVLANTLLASTYCAQPMGDTPSRKGIIDAIIMGCVPVVYNNTQKYLWPAHISRQEFVALSVYAPQKEIEENNLNMSQALATVSEKELERKQRLMADLALRVTLMKVPTTGDSLNILFRRILADAIVDEVTAVQGKNPTRNQGVISQPEAATNVDDMIRTFRKAGKPVAKLERAACLLAP